MSEVILTCQDEQRRQLVRDSQQFNGLDYLEVGNGQTKLSVFLLRKASEELIERFKNGAGLPHVVIEGGRRIRNVTALAVTLIIVPEEDNDDYFEVIIDQAGDFSNYTLRFAALDESGRATTGPMPGFDPRYVSLDFSFKADCPSDFDCKPRKICPPQKIEEPDINYLAKDYSSFRQIMLDRLTQTMPGWNERHVPDIGITLVEIMAYIGDYLSYFQDAVATEAYLDTARKRISVRRHARLVDYQMHEGCNARAWVHIELQGDDELSLIPQEIFFITAFPDAPPPGTILNQSVDLNSIRNSQYEVFEPLVENSAESIRLYAAHNRIDFYSWGDKDCCLPKGATSATLRDEWADENSQERKLHLKVGDFLIFEEIIGPKTANPVDADPKNRHVIRLTNVEPEVDELCDRTPVLNIEWAEEDKLPFSLCISAIGPPPNCELLENISIAQGNVLLVDHGRSIFAEEFDKVPLESSVVVCERENRPSDVQFVPGEIRPILNETPLTFTQALASEAPAANVLIQNPRETLPYIHLTSLLFDPLDEVEHTWEVKRDLLSSLRDDRHFVVEMDGERQAHLRFGDGELGRLPEPGLQFFADYRIGNGPAGNIGSERLTYLVHRTTSFGRDILLKPRNPFPATGGIAPEPLSEVKLFAPTAFRKLLERAVTPDDYALLAAENPKVQRASATFRWNGSWYEILVAIDPFGTVESDQGLIEAVERHLFRYRRMGHDLKVAIAQFVALDIALEVCVLPGFMRGHVKAALLDAFSSGMQSDGNLGFFHPDNLTFGEPIRISRLIALAQGVPGVESINVVKLERMFEGPNQEIENGILPIRPFEIARLDNDSSFPENGRLMIKVRGGR